MIDQIVTERSKGNPFLERTTRTKLLLRRDKPDAVSNGKLSRRSCNFAEAEGCGAGTGFASNDNVGVKNEYYNLLFHKTELR